MDRKRRLELRHIRDTPYFKPLNFTLNTLKDFVLTYSKQLGTHMSMQLSTGQKLSLSFFENSFYDNDRDISVS